MGKHLYKPSLLCTPSSTKVVNEITITTFIVTDLMNDEPSAFEWSVDTVGYYNPVNVIEHRLYIPYSYM